MSTLAVRTGLTIILTLAGLGTAGLAHGQSSPLDDELSPEQEAVFADALLAEYSRIVSSEARDEPWASEFEERFRAAVDALGPATYETFSIRCATTLCIAEFSFATPKRMRIVDKVVTRLEFIPSLAWRADQEKLTTSYILARDGYSLPQVDLRPEDVLAE